MLSHLWILTWWVCQASTSTHSTRFQHSGQIQETDALLHLSISLNLTEYGTACQRVERDLKQQLKRVKVDSPFKNQIEWSMQELSQHCQLLEDHLKHVPTRKRSFLAIATTLFSLIGLGKLLDFGHQQQVDGQIHTLVHHVQSLQDQVRLAGQELHHHQASLTDLYGRWKDFTIAIHEDERSQHLLREAAILQQHLERLLDGLHSLQADNLPPQLLTPTVIHTLWQRIANTTLRPLLPISHPTHLTQFPSSSYLDQSSLHLIIHIPVLNPSSPFNLYKLKSNPFYLTHPDNRTSLQAHLRPNSLALAVSADPLGFTLLDSDDLAGCLQRGKVYFCESLIRHTDFSSQCLARIYSNNFDQLERYCDIIITPVHHSVTPTQYGWRFFTTHPDNLLVQCRNGTEVSRSYQGFLDITKEPNCTYQTTRYRLLGNHRPLLQLQADRVNLHPIPHFNLDLPVPFNISTHGDSLDHLLRLRIEHDQRISDHWHSETSRYLLYGSLALAIGVFFLICAGTYHNYRHRPRHPDRAAH